MPFLYIGVVWLGAALDGFQDFGVGVALGFTLGIAVQWQLSQEKAPGE